MRGSARQGLRLSQLAEIETLRTLAYAVNTVAQHLGSDGKEMQINRQLAEATLIPR
jgi:hypothetical protein